MYATAFLAAVVILCDTKLARLRGRQRDSLLFLIPGEERFRSKASTTISVGSQFSSENHKLALTFVELQVSSVFHDRTMAQIHPTQK